MAPYSEYLGLCRKLAGSHGTTGKIPGPVPPTQQAPPRPAPSPGRPRPTGARLRREHGRSRKPGADRGDRGDRGDGSPGCPQRAARSRPPPGLGPPWLGMAAAAEPGARGWLGGGSPRPGSPTSSPELGAGSRSRSGPGSGPGSGPERSGSRPPGPAAPSHSFRKVTLTKPTFCHLCSDFIWGLAGILCDVCNFMSHEKCLKHVKTPCTSVAPSLVRVPVAHCFGPRGLYKRRFCSVCRKGLEAPGLRCEGTASLPLGPAPGAWALRPGRPRPHAVGPQILLKSPCPHPRLKPPTTSREEMGAEQAGEWDTATPLIWKQSEGSSWRTRVPPPLPAAPVTAQRFLQEDLYGIKKKEEREAEAQAALEANSEGSLT
ncbi:TPA: diacylglycerol kinase, theta-like, partial [Bos taurus]